MVQYTNYPNFGSVDPSFIAQHGYRAALGQAALESEQNDIARQEYLLERGLRAPAILGAQHVLGGGTYTDAEGNPLTQQQYDALTDEQKAATTFTSQFQPFVDQLGQSAVQAGRIGTQYAQNVPFYHETGLAGLGRYQQLAGYQPISVTGPDGQPISFEAYKNLPDAQKANYTVSGGGYDDQGVYNREKALADQYAKDYGEGAYQLAAKDINRQADQASRNLARDQGRFGALSSQKARADAYGDQARTDALLQAAERAKQVGYDRAQTDYQQRLGLAGNFQTLGATGLSQAQQGTQLSTAGAQTGIQAPFQPFNQYSAAIGQAPTVTQPNYGSVTDPYTTGLGLGLQAWGQQ